MDHPIKIELKDVSLDARDLDCTDLVFQFTDDSICKEWKTALMKARFTRLPKFAKSKVCILTWHLMVFKNSYISEQG